MHSSKLGNNICYVTLHFVWCTKLHSHVIASHKLLPTLNPCTHTFDSLFQILKDLRRHPYIVSLCEVIRDSDSTILMLDYVSNTPYLNGIANWSNYTESDAQTSMKQLLKAINYCHKHRIIHRVRSLSLRQAWLITSLEEHFVSAELNTLLKFKALNCIFSWVKN